jgi:hypothetical protein
MQPRTEDEILSRTPLKIKLGATDYDIPLLAVKAQREWRKKLLAALEPVLASFNFQADGKNMATGLGATLLNFPETLCDLVFAYAPDLDKEKVLAEATEEQIGCAFSAILAVAFPYLPQLSMVTQLMKTTAAATTSSLQ